MSDTCLIRGASLVTPTATRQLDVRIAGGRIAEIGPGLPARASIVCAAAGLHLLPGLIDDQVHFREPGLTHKADIATESAAAVAGGVTSFLEMPNTVPPTIDAASLQAKLARAATVSQANYGFYLGATGHNTAEIEQAAQAGACGIKVFLGASTGDLLVAEQAALEQLFAAVPPGMVLAAHCEDHARILQRTEQAVREHGEDLPLHLHPVIRDAVACHLATTRAIDLAHRHHTRLHVLHLTTAGELDLLERGPPGPKLVTAEACVHHLMFTDRDYATHGGRIKCNPAIKSATDRERLRQALTTGTIDVIATDHAPHLLAEKSGAYRQVAAGMPLVEHSLLVLLELVHAGILQLGDVARLGAHNPAQLFGIRDRGQVKVGYYADLVLVDLQGKTLASDATVRSKCGWTPFAGHEFPAAIRAVWVSGRQALVDGKLLPGVGHQLAFQRP